MRAALAERYEAGFKPLLAEAEARHAAELQRLVDLQRTLEAKEVRTAGLTGGTCGGLELCEQQQTPANC